MHDKVQVLLESADIKTLDIFDHRVHYVHVSHQFAVLVLLCRSLPKKRELLVRNYAISLLVECW